MSSRISLIAWVLIVGIIIFNCTNSVRYSRSAEKTHSSSQKIKTVSKHNKRVTFKKTITGIASYYGSGFHGKKTANGERFNMYGFTAAHKTLPFNTKIKVIHLKNNKSVFVRINDRGPFTKGRILDLSYGAAKKIGLLETGIGTVKIVIVP